MSVAEARGPHRYDFAPVDAVIHGQHALEELPIELDRLGAERVLLVSTRSVVGTDVFRLVDSLLDRRRIATFDSSSQHLPTAMADDLLSLAHDTRPDAVVTLGGGTVSDAGKAVAAGLALGVRRGADLATMRFVATADGIGGGLGPEVGPFVPQVAIPTTLSAAEYCGAFAMTEKGVKDGYSDIRLTPRVVILDPLAVSETPDWLWASTGMRAIDHAVEAYLSNTAAPPSDATAVAAAQLLLEHLPKSLGSRRNEGARLQCLVGGWLSMFGFHNAGLGLSHAIGHQLGARFGVPHGVTSCITLPPVTAMLAERVPDRTAALSRAIGIAVAGQSTEAAAAALVDRLDALVSDLPVPRRLRDVNVPAEAIDEIAQAVTTHTTAQLAPFTVRHHDVVAILDSAY